MKTILGLVKPVSGTVHWDGEEITSAELGGARQQELNGNVSYVARDEEDAFNWVHDLLDRLPDTRIDAPAITFPPLASPPAREHYGALEPIPAFKV